MPVVLLLVLMVIMGKKTMACVEAQLIRVAFAHLLQIVASGV